ncbi:tetratricopeptide repeat protein [Leptolyngbyaceae cyanobacterium UHCC 1019]
MTSDPIDWNEDVSTNPEQEYRALLKSLRRTRNFGLFFVQCSPVEGERLIQRIRQDLPQKQTEVLTLTATVTNLYDEVAALPNKDQIEILFIQGLEHSLYDYEQERLWHEPEQRYSYDESGVPKLLAHLNLSRERFRDHFKMCFVFLVPLFALKYLMRRAPDFFDWRSGVLEFAMDAERLEQESQRLWLENDSEEYLTWTPYQRSARILEIQALLEEPHQISDHKSSLLFEQSRLFYASKSYEAVITIYEKAIEIDPDAYKAWHNRGKALYALGRNEEAIASYDQAVAIQPDFHSAWHNRGNVLSVLGRNEEAITSYDQAIAIQPDFPYAWYARGLALSVLGRSEEAIASCEKAIEINPDDHGAWNSYGLVLTASGRTAEAIASYEKAVEINPDDHGVRLNRGNALNKLGRHEEAIASYDQAIAIKPDNERAWYNKACGYGLWGDIKKALENLQQAIKLNSDCRNWAKTDADFDGIRQDARFQELMGRNGE